MSTNIMYREYIGKQDCAQIPTLKLKTQQKGNDIADNSL